MARSFALQAGAVAGAGWTTKAEAGGILWTIRHSRYAGGGGSIRGEHDAGERDERVEKEEAEEAISKQCQTA